ncbi:LTA synthase family protein [Mesoterricola silvestris]|uniref:Sulfatase n=1 Tax=Mesoterricola silvestris TaxID=2927979 RepID=A0AA48GKA1_9BACT|nr:sulfatase-like hydrolase/transferase [Mesoterricola silvestris]BDU74591.1 sulfatase [Mesoterricola silvestris]
MPRTKLRLLAVLLALLVILFGLLRLAFLLRFGGAEGGTAHALYIGLKFDARLAAILVLPALLLLKAGNPGRPSRAALGALTLAAALLVYAGLILVAMVDTVEARAWLYGFLVLAGIHHGLCGGFGLGMKSARRIWAAYALAALSAVLLAYVADFGAYGYIHTRLNGTLVMFLENAGTSLKMVWQSYPVVRIALALAAVLALSAWGLRALASRLELASPVPRGRKALHALAAFGLLALMWGRWSAYPLRWAEAFELPGTFQAHLALNPVLFFLETRRDMDGGFDLRKVKASAPVMAEYFGIPEATDAEGLPTLARRGVPHPLIDPARRPNVVFIQLESFASFKTGIQGNPLDPTPCFDRLCREGIFFDRFYVAMENTSRSMFATLFGVPDVSAVENATRNPLLLDQGTVLSGLDAYSKTFFLGGSANWAQIRGVLKKNFPGLRIHEEGSFRSPVVDVWGISDADLLREAADNLGTQAPPFWSYIQTSGNHPPFTIPKHLKDFRKAELDPAALARGGFIGNDEFNAVRLMDHSLETFFEAARRQPWFADTVFVLWGDHGLPRGTEDPRFDDAFRNDVDKRFGDLKLAIHNVPLLIYAPGLLKPRRVHTVATQMDLLPTLSSLLGVPWRTSTLGKDALDPAFQERSAAFTFTTFRRPPRIGLLQGDYYLTVDPGGRAQLFRTDRGDPSDLAALEPARVERMRALAEGFHQWSKFLLSHNRPLKDRP